MSTDKHYTIHHYKSCMSHMVCPNLPDAYKQLFQVAIFTRLAIRQKLLGLIFSFNDALCLLPPLTLLQTHQTPTATSSLLAAPCPLPHLDCRTAEQNRGAHDTKLLNQHEQM